MSDRERAPLLALWWAAPTTIALAFGLAFAFGFAPRLADHVAVPRAIVVAPVSAGQHPRTAAAIPRHRPRPTSTPTPTATASPLPTFDGGRSGAGTVVQPSRPVVTADRHEDEATQRTSEPGDR